MAIEVLANQWKGEILKLLLKIIWKIILIKC
jgi:hypothetical protein